MGKTDTLSDFALKSTRSKDLQIFHLDLTSSNFTRSEVSQTVSAKLLVKSPAPLIAMSLAVLLNLALAAAGPPYAQLPRAFSPTATFQLKDGKQMPVMGLGVYMMKQGEETYNAAALAAATE